MSDSANRDVEVFEEAMRLPVEERAAYLDRICGKDSELRRQVESLLKVHDRVGDFLEQTPVDGLRRGSPIGEKPGSIIGRYKLLAQIGEGGCGVVYLAEQREPVRRRVALKIIKPGMDTKSVIARFEAERQTLALMDHPNIAKVFDAGATGSGRPFFVMELVQGVKITEYCDENSLTTEERLQLFVQVCHAVQHAHQKGIIHRDIKPSNILVTKTLEGDALPVVIDFGIAKATTNQPLTDKTVFTAFEMLIGTPAYMSPEQAALSNIDVDTRTDIYSLGVLLYELLTGKTPFDAGDLLKLGLDEVRRIIREKEPARPSTRLSKMTQADLTSVAENRKSEAPKLIRVVCGDLDWIAMKALEKDPARRYETANGLALDVQRYLANDVISARPPSRVYKFRKLVSRNKLLFGAISSISILLITSLALVTASLRQARTEAAKSEQTTQFLKDMLREVGPSVSLGRNTEMLQGILDKAADRASTALGNQPAVEAELRGIMGQAYQDLGQYDKAEKMYRVALALNQKLFGQESLEAAASFNDLGDALSNVGQWSEAESDYKRALGIRRKAFGNVHPDVATSLNSLANLYRNQGNVPEAVTLSQQALEINKKYYGNDSLEAADSLRNLAILLGDQDKRVDAKAMLQQVLAIRRKRLPADHPQVAAALVDVAWAAGYLDKLDEAEALEREALAMRRRLLGENHPDIAKSLYTVGSRLLQRKKLDEAYTFLTSALSLQRKLLGDANPTTLNTYRTVAMVSEAQGKLEESEAMHREILALWRANGQLHTPVAVLELEDLTHVLMIEKKFDDAEQLLDEMLTPEFKKNPITGNLLSYRRDLEARGGRWEGAAADASLATELQPLRSDRYSMLGGLLIRTGNRLAYERLRKNLLGMYGNTEDSFAADQVAKACLLFPPSDSDMPVIARLADIPLTFQAGDSGALPYFQVCKALSEYRQGHFAAATDWAQKTLKTTAIYAQGQAYGVLAMADWQLGRKDQARLNLELGNTVAARIHPIRYDEDPEYAWAAWLFARITLDEATALIHPDLTTNAAFNRP
jgi:serine/threonine protein kinase